MTADSLPLWNNPAGLIAGPQPDGFSSRGFNRLRQRLPRCNHCHSQVNRSFFFISFDLIILQRPIGLFKHWDLISEHRGNQASRPPRRDQTNSGAEPSRAEPNRAPPPPLPPSRLSVMSQPSVAAGFKMHPGSGLWIPSLPSRCQTFLRVPWAPVC